MLFFLLFIVLNAVKADSNFPGVSKIWAKQPWTKLSDLQRERFLHILIKHYTKTQGDWVPNKQVVEAGVAVFAEKGEDHVLSILNRKAIRTRFNGAKKDGPVPFVGMNTLEYFENGQQVFSESDADSKSEVADQSDTRSLKRGGTGRASMRRAKKKRGGKYCLFNVIVVKTVNCR